VKRPKLEIDDFHAQFHNHDHYHHHESGEHRLEWWELPEPRKRGGRVDFRNGGRAGYADGGGVDQLLQNLKGSFSNLNQQVAAQAPQQQQAPANYQAMFGQAPNDAYQRMMAQALNGKTYEGLFPKAATPAAPTTAEPAAPTAAAPVGIPNAPAFDYGSWMASLMGGDGSSSGAADAGGGTGGAGAAGADGAGGDGGASSAGGGSAFKRGGRTNNIVERALAATRRK